MDKRLSDRLVGSGGLTQYVTNVDVAESIEDSRLYNLIYTDYTITDPHGEDILVDVSTDAVTITLCDCPEDGAQINIGVAGDASVNNILINGDTNLIEDGTSYTIDTLDASVTLVYSGTQWESLKGEGTTIINNTTTSGGGGTIVTSGAIEPVFITPVEVANFAPSSIIGWTIFDTTPHIPLGVNTIILEAYGALSGPDTADVNADIFIRKDNSSPATRLLTGRAASNGDQVASNNQGVFPIGEDGTFQYVLEEPGFNLGATIHMIGYYGIPPSPTTIVDTYSTKQMVAWCDVTIGGGSVTFHDQSSNIVNIVPEGTSGNGYRLSMNAGTVASSQYYVAFTGGSFESSNDGQYGNYGHFAFSRSTMTSTTFDFVVGDPDSVADNVSNRFQIMIYDDLDIYKHILDGTVAQVIENSEKTAYSSLVKRLPEYIGGEKSGNSTGIDGLVYINTRDEIIAIGDASNDKLGTGMLDVDAPGVIIPLPPGVSDIPVKLYNNDQYNLLVLTNLGNVYSTGENGHGQLSHPGTLDKSPGRLTKCTVTNVKKVVQGDNRCRTFGYLTHSGDLYIAGRNPYGQIGNGTTTTQSAGAYNSLQNVEDAISCGSWNGSNDVQTFIALKNDGTVHTVGYGGAGQVGDGNSVNVNSSWHQVVFPSAGVVIQEIQVAGGDARGTILALDTTGRIWGWGRNGQGQLGLNNKTEQKSPVLIASNVLNMWTHGGYQRVFYKDTSHEVWMSGDNANGKGGIGHSSDVTVFTKVTSLTGLRVKAMFGYGGSETSGGTTIAISEDDKVYIVGRQNDGETGLGIRATNADQTTFTQIWGPVNGAETIHPDYETVPLVFIEYVSGGRSFVVSDKNELYGAGSGRWGIFNYANDDVCFFTRVPTL
jgi:alpha-tubulin suppressor-like RCC1 family protein